MIIGSTLTEVLKNSNPTQYNGLKRAFEDDGYISMSIKGKKAVKIYNFDLAMFFSEFVIQDISTTPYFESYCKAYKKGLKYFRETYLKDETLLFGAYKEAFEVRLNNDCFEKTNNWYSVKNKASFKLTNETIEFYGYHSALTSEADRIIDKYFEANKVEPTFIDYIHNVKNKEAFALELKETFNVERATNIKIMVEELRQNNIIELTDGQIFSFHALMKSYFTQDIGGYEAYRKAKFFDTIKKGKIIEKLKPLINKHKIKA
jgi:hypothetical protein